MEAEVADAIGGTQNAKKGGGISGEIKRKRRRSDEGETEELSQVSRKKQRSGLPDQQEVINLK
jgi:hypothetical protein